MMDPTGTSRIESLDLLRGLAVFGMLVVNVGYFASLPGIRPEGGDAVAAVAVQLLAAGKFRPLFAALFGYGFWLQAARASQRQTAFSGPYARRMIVLYLVGAAHALLHPAEILHRYAVLGLLLIPLRHASAGRLALVGLTGLLLPVAWPRTPAEPVDAAMLVATFTDGTLVDVATVNARRFVASLPDVRLLGALPFMVVGVLLARRGFLVDEHRHAQLRRVRWWLLAAGILLQLAPVLLAAASPDGQGRGRLIALVTALVAVGGAALGFFYAALVLAWWETPAGRRRLAPLAAVGRLALTNYLGQTLAVTTVLYGYGLGLYGRLGMAGALVLVPVVLGGQTWLSRWWVGRYRYGPAEWLWRRLASGPSLPL